MEKERLLFCIERFDHYYDSINNKCTVFLGLATFIVGGLLAAYPAFIEHIKCDLLVNTIIAILIGISLVIMIIVVLTSIPFLSGINSSMYYFESICSKRNDVFKDRSRTRQDEDDLNDLRDQVYQLASGLKSKFYKLRIVGVLFLIQFILFVPLIISFLSSFKLAL